MKTITKLLLFTVVIFMASSCATLFSGKSYTMSISSSLPNSEIIINNTDRRPLPADIIVTRSKENLNLKILQNDSVINDTILRPRLSNEFWWGNLFCLGLLAPIGWLVDLQSENRFTYGRFIYIDSLGNIQRFRKRQQGDFGYLIALPYINFFHLNPQNYTPRNLWGFIGLGFGIEYFYRNNKSFQLRGDAIIDFPIPILLGDPQIAVDVLNVSLTDNFHINRFQLGYGLNFARKNSWWSNGRNNMLGLALSTHYRFTNSFYFGVIYRPSFWELSRNRLMYEHTISVDFMWKIRF